jgi:hypothetical protein
MCADVAQLVERQPSKLNVAGSIPVVRSQTGVVQDMRWLRSWLRRHGFVAYKETPLGHSYSFMHDHVLGAVITPTEETEPGCTEDCPCRWWNWECGP